ncbi:hypothetical protein XPA_007903 [Xanthoria parietina]
MPDILYVYKSPEERDKFFKKAERRPVPKYIGNDVMYEKWPMEGKDPRILLDFPHLPDQVGTNEWWWVFEAWRRLDPRITWKDIHMRQYGPNRKAHWNTIQKLVSRNRSPAMMVTWPQQRDGLKTSNEKRRVHDYDSLDLHRSSIKTTSPRSSLLRLNQRAKVKPRLQRHPRPRKQRTIKNVDWVTPLMTDAQKEANTTRGLTPGLIDKALGDVPENRVPWPGQLKRAGKHRPKRARAVPRSGEQSLGVEGGAASDPEAEPSTDNSGEDQGSISSEHEERPSEQALLAPASTSYGSRSYGTGYPSAEASSSLHSTTIPPLHPTPFPPPFQSGNPLHVIQQIPDAYLPPSALNPLFPTTARRPRITAFVRDTCPAGLAPERWAEFLEFCVERGIAVGRRRLR